METIGIRELKTHLSHHLKRVRAGTRLLVTARGQSIATIAPAQDHVQERPDLDWVYALVEEGHAQWSGRKPTGASRPIAIHGKTAAARVLEDRR